MLHIALFYRQQQIHGFKCLISAATNMSITAGVGTPTFASPAAKALCQSMLIASQRVSLRAADTRGAGRSSRLILAM